VKDIHDQFHFIGVGFKSFAITLKENFRYAGRDPAWKGEVSFLRGDEPLQGVGMLRGINGF